jgi:hypothetical protein
MTALRQRLLEDLQLRGYSAGTQQLYVRAVRQLAAHYGKSPADITEEELRQYFLYLTQEKRWSPSSCTVALCGIKFFYEYTLQRRWPTLDLVRPAQAHKLPVVLRVEEGQQVLAQVRKPAYRVCLSTIYACGLRVSEGRYLQVADMDSARMMSRCGAGKMPKTAISPCPNERCCTCASTGSPIAIRFGCSPSSPGARTHGRARDALGLCGGSAGPWHPQARHHPYAAPFLGHASAGVRRQSAPDSDLVGAHLAEDHRPLHSSDPQGRGAGSGRHQSVDGEPGMVELADIFRQDGPAYRAKFAERLLPSHLAAMRAIEQCRGPSGREVLGGHVYYCPACEETCYSYHSCRNRHCPKCQHNAAQIWLEKQRDLLLPVPSLPAGLRAVAYRHQQVIYDLLFRTSAEALQQRALDPRFVGGPGAPWARSGRRAPNLDAGFALSSPRAFPRAGRWTGRRW